MTDATTAPLRQQRQLQRDERRARTAAIASGGTPVETLAFQPRLSFQAQVLQRAFPPALVADGHVVRQPGDPNRGHFAPALFARNPQHGRTVNRIVEQLARSFAAHGQQESILARLITETDRRLWPDVANDSQIFFIIDGHQRCAAATLAGLPMVWAEVVLPRESESDGDYRRRCLTMASIKMMQSQAYDIFDKVNQVKIWMAEFSMPQLPSKAELADMFHISATEAHRIRTVTRLRPEIEERIKAADNKPADEVIAIIASFPEDEQLAAFERFGTLPVSQARTLLQQEKGPAESGRAPGRPQNYVYRVSDPESDIVAILTRLSPEQWKAKGGTTHFWQTIQRIGHSRQHQDRLKADLD